ncbi:TAT-variant-translocated molybdopterin oxidoreductase [Rubritalea marina]|uniref:TAT-variant-translocated molybdopterin oxidoreductase n=1 Tax=Rubritalea marina TaxID=361055 RepID=UPI0003770417|nr:TAT-variant-translocated molybdopterin oxidoreductase [Rubritalea marina]
MSKRKWQHPEIPANEASTKVWRSAGELEDTHGLRQWLEREFPRAAETMIDEDDRETSRRSFMKVMGASTALAGFGLAACRRPEELIVPYVNAPEWVIPGKPLYYASSIPTAGGAVPAVVTNYQGRPTKLEPNRIHPGNDGQSAFDQASILDLYNPARSRDFLNKGQKVSRATAEKQLAEWTASGKVGFVFGEDDSATRTHLRGELAQKFAGAKFYSYEALAGAGRKASNEAIFGAGAELVADYAQAKAILSLDSDFLELDKQGPVKGFYDRRHVNGRNYDKDAVQNKKNLNRLYVAEPTYSLTGGMADHRAPVAPSQIGRFLAQLASELGVSVAIPGGKFTGKKEKWVKECAKDLAKHRGEALVLLGSRYDKELHDLAHLVNVKLGAYGKSLNAVKTQKAGLANAEQLVADINAKALDTVILLTPANPVLENEALTEALSKVKIVQLGLRLNASANAADLHVPAAHYLESWGDSFTSSGVYTIVQPMILPLYGGVSELELLLALRDGKLHDSNTSALSPAYTAVRKTFDSTVHPVTGAKAAEAAWMKLLREGFLKGSQYALASVVAAPPVPALKAQAEPSAKALDIVYSTDGSVFDGRYIDNAWLQEAPDPISKVCWDNAIYLAPETAKDLGIYEELVELEKKGAAWWASLGFDDRDLKKSDVPEEGEGPSLFAPVAKITINGKTLEAPVIVAFGMAANVISISLGYGQGYDEHFASEFKNGGISYNQDGKGNVSSVGVNAGFNAYPLRGGVDYFAQGASIARAENGATYKMARTQEHHSMYGRALAREISTAEDKLTHKDYAAQIKGVQKQGMDSHIPENMSLYKGVTNGGPITSGLAGREEKPNLFDKSQQWAMSIDLNVCNGCNACLVACQAENNIPVVGKTQVAMGREMHWIRMDRYFAAPDLDQYPEGTDEWEKSPEMIPQPVACVQCESAPCETVCPVNATVHSEDGLNTMAYNRCIGTRYCANNCPYKARRFNFFDYNKRNPLIHKNLYKGPMGVKQEGDSKSLQRNPNVSVRMRGVMEKCTYCVQRLQSAKIEAKKLAKQEALAVAGGSTKATITAEKLMPKTDSVRVACQDACDAGAIVFGNLLDPKSMISRIKDENNKIINDRAYDLLNYIGTRPRTSYLARVKNPNTNMPGKEYVGKATVHMH